MSDEKTSGKGIQGATPMDNYASINESKKARKPQDQLKAEACFNVADMMLRAPESFGMKLVTIKTEDNAYFVVEVDDKNVCRPIPTETALMKIQKFLYTKWNVVGGRKTLTGSSASEILTLFMGLSTPIDENSIKPVGQYGDDKLCWTRLEWPIEPGETPTYDELFSRMSDPAVVKAWIGGLFHKESDRSQYLWINSEGGDGKSSLANVISKILGRGATNEVVPQPTDKFWTSGLVGKRFVCFPDAGKANFVGTDMFKSLTGDSSQKIEYKGKTPITLQINPKFMFLSNKKPEISRINADIRRAVLIDLHPATQYVPAREYDKLLWEEAPHFIHQCLTAYARLCPQHERLPISDAVKLAVDEQIEQGEEKFTAIFNKRLVDGSERIQESRNKHGGSYKEACDRLGMFVESDVMQQIFNDFNLGSNKLQSDFYKFLRARYHVVRDRMIIKGKRTRVYLGCRVREDVPNINAIY